MKGLEIIQSSKKQTLESDGSGLEVTILVIA